MSNVWEQHAAAYERWERAEVGSPAKEAAHEQWMRTSVLLGGGDPNAGAFDWLTDLWS